MVDAEFSSTTFVVLDVELRSQLGGPVPAAVAALALSGKDWQPLWRVHQDIRGERTLSSAKPRPPRLPHELPEGSAGRALQEIERHLTAQPHRIVAALFIEAALLRDERAACARLASLILWDAVALARRVCPDVEGGLKPLAQKLGVNLPPGRRSAAEEAWAVSQVLGGVDTVQKVDPKGGGDLDPLFERRGREMRAVRWSTGGRTKVSGVRLLLQNRASHWFAKRKCI